MTTATELLDIGQVIEASGIPASTLHVWERAGLITPVQRNGLRRQFDLDVLARISLIVISKRAGFSLGEIGELFAPGAFDDGKELLETKLNELRLRRAELDAAINGLEHAIACPAPSPFACERFRSTLPNVLPVD
jgi:DNA-binding transcriptional MerR regulator